MNKKIKQALKEGRLIDFDTVFNSYPRKRQEAILKRVRYIKAAMELRRLRKKLRISQQKLAQKMKVEREFIARIESGRQNLTLETFYRIAEATNREFKFKFC